MLGEFPSYHFKFSLIERITHLESMLYKNTIQQYVYTGMICKTYQDQYYISRNIKPKNSRRKSSSEKGDEHEKEELLTNNQYTALRIEVTDNRRGKLLGSEDKSSLTQSYDDQSHGDGTHNCDQCKPQRVQKVVLHAGDIKYDGLGDVEQKCQHNQKDTGRDAVEDTVFEEHYSLPSAKQTQNSKKSRKDSSVHTLWTSPPSKTYTSNSSIQPSLPPIPTNNNLVRLIIISLHVICCVNNAGILSRTK